MSSFSASAFALALWTVSVLHITGASSKSYGDSSSASSGTSGSTFSAASTSFPTANQGCFPNNIPSTNTSADPLQRMGKYFGYMSKFAPSQTYNAMFVNSLVKDGLVYLPGRTKRAGVHYTTQYTYATQAGGYKCLGGPVDVLARYDGIAYFQYFGLELASAVPRPDVVYYLFESSGPQGYEIFYDCGKYNYNSGTCDEPHIFVNTRVHPSQLSVDQRHEIDDTVDRVLKPFCSSKSDLQKPILDDSLAKCPPHNNVAFDNLVSGYSAALAGRNPDQQ